jgi:hypothetical protein
MTAPMPTEVFVVMARDTEGELRGYHKIPYQLWHDKDQAQWYADGITQKFPHMSWTVVPSVILTREEYQGLVSLLAGAEELNAQLKSELSHMEDREYQLVSERDGLDDELAQANEEICRLIAERDSMKAD